MKKSRAVYGDNINAELKGLAENIQIALANTTLETVSYTHLTLPTT